MESPRHDRTDRRLDHLKKYLASPSFLLMTIDKEGVIFFVSDSVAGTFDIDVGDITGKGLEDLSLPQEVVRQITVSNLKVLRSKKSVEGEIHSPTPHGAKWFGYDISPVLDDDGELEGTVLTATDITNLKEAQTALGASEARYRSLFENGLDAVLLTRPDGSILMSNLAARRMFGMTEDELRRAGRDGLVVKDEQLAAFLNKRRKMGRARGELTYRRKDGSTFPGETSSNVFTDADGESVTSLIIHDVTEHKAVEEALRASQRNEAARRQELETLMDTVPATIWISRDPEGTDMFGNRSTESLLRVHRGSNVSENAPPEQRQMHFRAYQDGKEILPDNLPMQMAGRTGRPVLGYEFEMRFLDGRSVWLYGNAVPLMDEHERTTGAVGAFIDVTERRQAEEAIARQASLIDLSPDAFVVKEGTDTITFWSHGAERLYGWTKDEAIGRKIRQLLRTEYPQPQAILLSILKEDGRWTGELVHQTKGGDRVIVQSRWMAGYDEDGGLVEIYESNVDITQRKEQEEELREAKASAELYLDLLTHDISNYNTAAMGYLQLAEMRLNLSDRDRRLIEVPLQELRNSTELIANIRDIQQLEAKRGRNELTDVCDMLKEIREEFKSPPGRSVTISLEEGEDCSAMVPSLLRSAFSNLVSNAINHSTGPVHIWISLNSLVQDGRGYLEVSVEDDGPGIPDETKKRLFTRSIRGMTKGIGHGLGLYLVRRLVEDSKGKVWVDDRVPGDHTKGARFVVLLPR